MAGTQNIKEILDLAKVIALHIIAEIAKDGYQHKDLISFLQSDEFTNAVKPAIEGIGEVPAEALDLDVFEAIDLAQYGYQFGSEILTAIKTIKG